LQDQCSKVLASRKPGDGNVTFCLDGDGLPKLLQIVLDPAYSGQTNAGAYTITAVFNNVTLGPLPADTFERPASCMEGPPPATCPQNASAPTEENLTVFHLTHAAGKNCGLNNLMTNDLHATWSFAGMGYDPNFGYEYVQVYNVTVRRDFAPIQDCNYNMDEQQMLCDGGHRTAANAKNVGRSSEDYCEGPFNGQCAENALVGSWYSFPSIGECAAGWDLGFQSCSWKTLAFKVVAMECIYAHCKHNLETGLDDPASRTTCQLDGIAKCPDVKEAMGPTCFSKPQADIHV